MGRSVDPKVVELAAAIVTGNKGVAAYSVTRAAEIAGLGYYNFREQFDQSGLLAKPSGASNKHKRIDARTLAEFMLQNGIPITRQ